ncbi:hypothetical protein FOA52_012500 [Chlamydomonas sp. UWO 241]|nr:hypothetical protein FOA52_012500 [Chlamydomonas sp. UWO 241]
MGTLPHRRVMLCCAGERAGSAAGPPQVPIIDAASTTPDKFAALFDAQCRPALLRGAIAGWPVGEWTFERLVQEHGGVELSVSRPTGGRAPMALRDYVDYMQRQADEEPLYVFDAGFVEAAPKLRTLYDTPALFPEDHFALLGEDARPIYRWLVAGPARAGAAWHVDPTLTSAWNALLNGRKRWLLYPPSVLPPAVQPGSSESFTTLQWLLEVAPTLPPHQAPIEVVQEAGDVMFVPGGWWHAVLNLLPSVAVTQNFVSAANVRHVLRHMAHGSAHYHSHAREYYNAGVAAGWSWPAPGCGLRTWDDVSDEDSSSSDGGSSDDGGDNQSSGGGGGGGAGRGDNVGGDGGVGQAAAGGSGGGGDGKRRVGVVDVGGHPCPKRRKPTEQKHKQQGQQPDAAQQAQLAAMCGMALLAVELQLPGGSHPDDQEGEQPAFGEGGRNGGAGSRLRQRQRRQQERGREGRQHPLPLDAWRRDRHLGPFARALWAREPRLRCDIAACMDAFMGRQALRALVDAVVSAAAAADVDVGIDEPRGDDESGGCGLDSLPIAGASSLVFLRGGLCIKFVTEEVRHLRPLMGALEAAVPLLLRRAWDGDADSGAGAHAALPELLAFGMASVCVGASAGSHGTQQQAATLHLPFVVSRRLPAAAESLRQRLPAPPPRLDADDAAPGQAEAAGQVPSEVAAQLGTLMARLHLAGRRAALQRPACSSRAAAGAHKQQQQQPGSLHAWVHALMNAPQHSGDSSPLADLWVWHDRHGGIWASRSDGTHVAGRASMEEALRPAAPSDPGQPAAGAAPATTAEAQAPGAQAHGQQQGRPALVPDAGLGRWSPFVRAMRLRAADAPDDLEDLPPHLLAQLDAYLPADAAQLLGFELPDDVGAPAGSSGAQAPSERGASEPLAAAEGAAAGAAAAAGARAGATGGPRCGPWLLHGDVTSGNVMQLLPPGAPAQGASAASRGGSPAVAPLPLPLPPSLSLLDFADAGHGDPLFDLVVMCASCLSLEPAACAAAWEAYAGVLDVAALWPHAASRFGSQSPVPPPVATLPPGEDATTAAVVVSGGTAASSSGGHESGVGGGAHGGHTRRLSYVAMVYLLLHEEECMVLERELRKRPGLSDAARHGGLPALQAALWGFLDNVPVATVGVS